MLESYVSSLVDLVVLEKNFFLFHQCISLFRTFFPLQKVKALYLNKLASPTPKYALGKVWLKSAQRFWRIRFLKFRQCIFAISFLSPSGKRWLVFIWTNLIPMTQWCCVVQSLVEIGHVVLKKKTRMRKLYDNNDANDVQSSLEPSIQVHAWAESNESTMG